MFIGDIDDAVVLEIYHTTQTIDRQMSMSVMEQLLVYYTITG